MTPQDLSGSSATNRASTRGRIAALGLSMGVEQALRAAAECGCGQSLPTARGAATLGDEQVVAHRLSPVFVSETWRTMRSIELVWGEAEPRR